MCMCVCACAVDASMCVCKNVHACVHARHLYAWARVRVCIRTQAHACILGIQLGPDGLHMFKANAQ